MKTYKIELAYYMDIDAETPEEAVELAQMGFFLTYGGADCDVGVENIKVIGELR